MLILSRKKDEGIRIGKDIEIVVIDIEGERVKLGIRAPKNVSVLRRELIAETELMNRESVKIAISDLKAITKSINSITKG